MRGKLVVGNWKMHGGLRQNDALLADLRAGWQPADAREIAVCVPFPYLWQARLGRQWSRSSGADMP